MGVQAVAYAFSIAATEVVGWYAVAAFAVNMVASAIISKAFFSPPSYDLSGQSPNPGNRQQVPPATDNKLPVVYGSAWVGGTITDLSITEDNQNMYFVLALSEVTNTPSSAPDSITFGDIYYGGKKVIFDSTYQYKVTGLLDESTGLTDTAVAGKIEIYLYSNGSNSPYNSSQSAISVMQASGLQYQWDNTKLMSNCAFAIVHLTYNQEANVTGLSQTKFNVINSRYQVGDCISDFLTNTRYGCSIPTSQIDATSLSTLNTYCNESFTYTTYTGTSTTQTRFRFDGAIDTSRTCMQILQDIVSCCDALLTYNEITAQWGVITQKPAYTVAMDLNDSNIISSLQVTPIDLAGSYNIIEVKFPDKTSQDAFNSVTFDLATIAPSLLYANEPVNKMSVALPFVNDNVRAQYIANRLLKSAREDLQLQAEINYVGIQLQAGDVVTVTNANYGWVAKLFRVNKVVETYTDDGSITAKLTLSEFNPSVYDDVAITQFSPAPNTGIPSPTTFGTIPAPVISSQQPTSANPSFNVSVTTSSAGITQYAEIWYSAFATPTSSQRIFAGTTAIQSNGNPYDQNFTIPDVTLSNIPSGNWYFFSRMVNSIATSPFSSASSLFAWKPTTVQYSNRWLVVAYADNSTGTSGFTTNPRGKAYYGLTNQTSSSPVSDPTQYTWYQANPSFGTDNYLLFNNRTGRRFSFATGTAGYAAATGTFVPTDTATYDPSTWSGLPDGTNYIDLDHRTGQLTETGTTTVGTGEIKITNNSDGKIVASLAPLLDFGGANTYTASVAKLTIDKYGRVLGFEPPDDFNYTMEQFNATSGQTVFHVTRSSTYLINNCFVFKNGVLLDESEYTDTAGSTGNVTLATAATLGDIITIISFRADNLITGAYNAFSRNVVDVTAVSEYTASGFTLVSGYELLFLNGTVVNDQDYDIIGQTITNFPDLLTGRLTIIQWTPNNLEVPSGTPINVAINSTIGQDTYPFSYVANALNIYQNGVLLDADTDYTAGFGEYTLAEVPTDVNQILLQQTFDRTGAV